MTFSPLLPRLVHGYQTNPYQNLRRIEILKDEPIVVVSVGKSMLDQVHSKLTYEHIRVKKYASLSLSRTIFIDFVLAV